MASSPVIIFKKIQIFYTKLGVQKPGGVELTLMGQLIKTEVFA